MNLLLVIVVLGLAGWFVIRRAAVQAADGDLSTLHSRPSHHGAWGFLMIAGPAFALWAVWAVASDWFLLSLTADATPPQDLGATPAERSFFLADVVRVANGEQLTHAMTPALETAASHFMGLRASTTIGVWILCIALAGAGLYWTLKGTDKAFRARNRFEAFVGYALMTAAAISILVTIGIVFSVLFESIRFFQLVSPTAFLFGLEWSPQIALRADQAGSSGAFGAVPLFAGTMLVTLIAMFVAGPIGMLSAIYLSQYASPETRSWAKPALEVLAGVPTVVYGFFAALTVAPFIRDLGESIGIPTSSESALAAGMVMGVMIIPFVASLSDDALRAVPLALRDASLGLGATQAETITNVLVPAALPGIIGGFLLAVSRAIGETMIVVMAAGLAANLTANPLDAVTTVTVQIVTLLVGDQSFDSAKTLAAFALGLVLFTATLALNVVALRIMQKYREKYD